MLGVKAHEVDGGITASSWIANGVGTPASFTQRSFGRSVVPLRLAITRESPFFMDLLVCNPVRRPVVAELEREARVGSQVGGELRAQLSGRPRELVRSPVGAQVAVPALGSSRVPALERVLCAQRRPAIPAGRTRLSGSSGRR